MQKIPTLFERNFEGDRRLHNEVAPGCEWVIAGEGVATEKFDGTAAMYKDGVLYKRFDAKHGKTPPDGFIPLQEPDPITGHWPGWVVVTDEPTDQYFREAERNCLLIPNGTYELVGKKVQRNPYNLDTHELWPHGMITLGRVPTTFEGLLEYLKDHHIEGVVWHHPDGRMCKIKRKDFGIQWP